MKPERINHQLQLRLRWLRRFIIIVRSGVFSGKYYARLTGVDLPASQLLWSYVKKTGDDYLVAGQLDNGWRQLDDPHPCFDTAYYLLRYFPEGLTENPLVHYLSFGWQEGRQPGPFFDLKGYRQKEMAGKAGDPLRHYAKYGEKAALSPGPHFDRSWYLDCNPSLRLLPREAFYHYKTVGASQKKSPLPLFDPDHYLSLQPAENRPFVALDPLAHCITQEDTGAGSVPVNSWFFPDNEVGQKRSPLALLQSYLSEDAFQGLASSRRARSLAQKAPLLSVVVPVYNPALHLLRNCLRSVSYQSYPHWQLCLVDDGSNDPAIAKELRHWAARDSRISLHFLPQNQGISGATNAAVELAEGEYICFLDNDDELVPTALEEVAATLMGRAIDVLYSDETLVNVDGKLLSVFRKPRINGELLLSYNYITHFVVVRRSLFKRLGGLDSKADGAQDYDLLLRLFEATEKIYHLPKLLYRWRASENSTSINHQQKGYAHEAGKAALQRAVVRRGLAGTILEGGMNYYYRFKPELQHYEKVEVFLWVAEPHRRAAENILSLVDTTIYEEVTYTILSPHPIDGNWLLGYADGSFACEKVLARTRFSKVAAGCGRTRALQRAVAASKALWLAFVEIPFKSLNHDWLDNLMRYASLKGCKLAMGRVCEDGDDLQYWRPDTNSSSVGYYYRFLILAVPYVHGLHCTMETPCSGWELCLVEKDAYRAVGGFREDLYPNLFAMVDLSLRLRENGHRVLFSPDAVLGLLPRSLAEDKACQEEMERFKMRHKKSLLDFGPWYNDQRLVDAGQNLKQYRHWFAGEPKTAS